jgi:apolipoprotein N-acyltransferase
MSNERTSTYPIADRRSYLWLAIGTVLALFSSGRWAIPLAAWLGSVFLIRFVRTQKASRGFFLAWLGTYLPTLVAWWGMMPRSLQGPAYFVTLGMSTLTIVGMSYLADRLLAPRIKGFAQTLVFPTALTAADFLSATFSPVGSFGAQAYAQYGNPALVQLLSITGMWGVTFLVGWFGSVANWIWECSFDWATIRRGAMLYVGINLLVMAYGGARLALSPVQEGTVRVAALTVVKHEGLTIDDKDVFRQQMDKERDRYFEQTIREARAGAKIVLWPEEASVGFEEDEAALIARGREVAAQEGIYLAMPQYTIYEQPNRLPANKLIVAGPAGEVVLEHQKYGAGLLEGIQPGDRVLRTFKSPYGTLSGLVCWDADFPATVRQAGRNGTDILLVSSNDTRAIDPMHTQMAVFRAIENGVSLVRQASGGLSIATDPYGRVLARMDHWRASEWVMVAQVPTEGVFTLYSVVGDLFGWLAVAGFSVIVVWQVIRGRRARRTTEPAAN